MKKILLFIIICSVSWLSFGCGNPEDKAQGLFIKASNLVKSAQEAEHEYSYVKANELYKEAHGDLEKIISDYQSTQLAKRIEKNTVKIGPYSYVEYKSKVLPQIQALAEEYNKYFVSYPIKTPQRQGLFEARLVLSANSKEGIRKTVFGSHNEIVLEDLVVLDAMDVKTIRLSRDDYGIFFTLELTGKGAKKFERFTANHIDESLGLIMIDQLISAPVIKEKITRNNIRVTGRFSENQAKEMFDTLIGRAT